MTKRRLLPLSLLLFPLCFTVAAQDSPAPRLEIVIVQDDGAINNIKQRTARETIVEVRDENHKPVAAQPSRLCCRLTDRAAYLPAGERVRRW